jgi:hypothetical protein
VSGGEFHPTTTKPVIGLPAKTFDPRHMMFYFYLLCSQNLNAKVLLKPDAVKIFITDCLPTVKRNSFSSTGNGSATSRIGSLTNAGTIKPC